MTSSLAQRESRHTNRDGAPERLHYVRDLFTMTMTWCDSPKAGVTPECIPVTIWTVRWNSYVMGMCYESSLPCACVYVCVCVAGWVACTRICGQPSHQFSFQSPLASSSERWGAHESLHITNLAHHSIIAIAKIVAGWLAGKVAGCILSM